MDVFRNSFLYSAASMVRQAPVLRSPMCECLSFFSALRISDDFRSFFCRVKKKRSVKSFMPRTTMPWSSTDGSALRLLWLPLAQQRMETQGHSHRTNSRSPAQTPDILDGALACLHNASDVQKMNWTTEPQQREVRAPELFFLRDCRC